MAKIGHEFRSSVGIRNEHKFQTIYLAPLRIPGHQIHRFKPA